MMWWIIGYCVVSALASLLLYACGVMAGRADDAQQ